MTTVDDDAVDLDVDRLGTWLREVLDATVSRVRASRIVGGNSSGAWRLDIEAGGGNQVLVLKAPSDAGMVFDCDASREGRILDAARRAGAPVPAIAAIDERGDVLGRPCFVMEFVDGRGVPESTPASFHGDGWFRDAHTDEQRAIWGSFIDALAALHTVDVSSLESAKYGPNGLIDVLDYWRHSLLDAAPAERVPRQLRILDWLGANLPTDAEDAPALCMGDSRLGNAILVGTDVRALLDFEVAYIGNPAADIGYCLMSDMFTRILSDRPAAGIPPAEETWERWGAATNRRTDHREYWTAFGATVLCITGTRAMLKWGMPMDTVDDDNLVVPEWESLIDRAAG